MFLLLHHSCRYWAIATWQTKSRLVQASLLMPATSLMLQFLLSPATTGDYKAQAAVYVVMLVLSVGGLAT
jgi:hypothetical protein